MIVLVSMIGCGGGPPADRAVPAYGRGGACGWSDAAGTGTRTGTADGFGPDYGDGSGGRPADGPPPRFLTRLAR